MMRYVLVLGDHGADVKALQKALESKGFSPGLKDGDFGSGTFMAVTAFQKSRGLLADGIAGPRTLSALGLAESAALPDATGHMTVQVAAQMLPGALLNNIKANLPIVLASLAKFEVGDRTMVLMAIATIRAETAGCVPISEGRSAFNTSPSVNGHPFDLYDFRSDLGNTGSPDGARYKGRGFVQLTGRHNYGKYGPRLPVPQDLVAQPELANAATIAADLLSLFLADQQLAIKAAILDGNYQEARRLVNGGKHGLAQFEASFRTGDSLMPR